MSDCAALEASRHWLSEEQRAAITEAVERDGYAVLPTKLSPADCEVLSRAVLRHADPVRDARPAGSQRAVKMQNIVDVDPVFLELAMYPPALQLSYSAFGSGMFHINQSNFIARPREAVPAALDFLAGSPWHADGPRPAAKGSPFPSPSMADGAVGLHYLKFGYFFTDLSHGTGGSLEVVPGSHTRRELDGLGGAATGKALPAGHSSGGPGGFDPAKYTVDKLDVPAGTIVVFHQAQWHAAMPNLSDVERLNAYISYCPTWMRPVDRDFPSMESLVARGLGPEARWVLGEPRAPIRWWIPSEDDLHRMDRFAPNGINLVASDYDAAAAEKLV
jgi:hypothetical protein